MGGHEIPEFEREWTEFLNEVRTALPGVQLLFGFLLTVPFTQNFRNASVAANVVFSTCFLATTAACAFLIAPTVYHRLHWRRDVHDKEEMLKTCNRLAIAGIVLLAVAMSAAVFFVTWTVFPHEIAALVTGVGGGLFLWLWFGLPLWRRKKERLG